MLGLYLVIVVNWLIFLKNANENWAMLNSAFLSLFYTYFCYTNYINFITLSYYKIVTAIVRLLSRSLYSNKIQHQIRVPVAAPINVTIALQILTKNEPNTGQAGSTGFKAWFFQNNALCAWPECARPWA